MSAEQIRMMEGHQRVMPYLIVEGAPSFIDFLQQAFEAKERLRIPRTENTVMHAEVAIGDSTIMLADATEEYRPAPANLYIYVDDTDKRYGQALEAGAVTVMAPFDESYGARAAGVRDPFGNTWWLAALQ